MISGHYVSLTFPQSTFGIETIFRRGWHAVTCYNRRSSYTQQLRALQQGAFTGPGAMVGLKYFDVYGPNEAHQAEMRSMVLKAYEQIQNTGVVRLFKSYRPEFRNREQARDFPYVDDAVAITMWFIEHPEIGGIFNADSEIARTWNDLARAVFTALRREPQIEYVDMPLALRNSYQYSTRAILKRLHAAGYPLEDGVRNYIHGIKR